MNRIDLLYFKHNLNVKPHHIHSSRISYYDLTIVLKGTLTYVVRNEAVSLKAGDFILFRPRVEYRQRLDGADASEYVSFNFNTDMDLDAVPTVSTNGLSDEMRLLLTVCDGLYSTEKDLSKIAYLLGSLLQLIRENVNNRQMHPLALEIKNYLLKNYTDRITLEDIAERFHFSVSYCNNVFRKETGRSIVLFLIEERMRKAKELLTYTAFTLPEIAVRVGYEDYNYFSRLFKKYTHFTPTQYRARYSAK